jgi:hypothetical protein
MVSFCEEGNEPSGSIEAGSFLTIPVTALFKSDHKQLAYCPVMHSSRLRKGQWAHVAEMLTPPSKTAKFKIKKTILSK